MLRRGPKALHKPAQGKAAPNAVPPEAWSFPIGGYAPAQKWLKDRKGRALSYEEQTHYPRLIAALAETARRMVAIDADIATAGGWPLK